VVPPVAVATESYPPNLAVATARLHPRGVAVGGRPDEPPVPFADAAFDLVTSRHPATVWWTEIARVLQPGGTYLGQHVGPASASELIELFLGPPPSGGRRARHPDDEVAQAEAAGLQVVDLRTARLRMEIFDIGAVVYLLRKVVWWVPGFTVEQYGAQLRALHEHIESHGSFVAHSTRHLVDARRR
jgi:SAM-dependent methyltransferase